MPELNNKQHEAFCSAYLKHFSAHKAAIEAGYAESYAHSFSHEILAREDVQMRLTEIVHSINGGSTEVTVEKVLTELHRIASSDLVMAFDEKNCLLPLVDIPEDIRRCIASIEVDEIWEGFGAERTQVGVTKKIKLWDKNKALEMLGKYLKLFVERKELSVSDSLEALLTASWGNMKTNEASRTKT